MDESRSKILACGGWFNDKQAVIKREITTREEIPRIRRPGELKKEKTEQAVGERNVPRGSRETRELPRISRVAVKEEGD